MIVKAHNPAEKAEPADDRSLDRTMIYFRLMAAGIIFVCMWRILV